MSDLSSRILYEDNHLIIINKKCGELVQGDKSGDITLADEVKAYLKQKYNKPGNVYLGIPHRLDRPTSGIVIYTKTEKALIRLNDNFKGAEVSKLYWAVVDKAPEKPEGTLVHYVLRNSANNKSIACTKERKGAKLAKLDYKVLSKSDNYTLLEIRLHTGRHHQIRCQLAQTGLHIKGDLKYGYPRSNPNGGIHLHARSVSFIHPVSKAEINLTAPVPDERVWNILQSLI